MGKISNFKEQVSAKANLACNKLGKTKLVATVLTAMATISGQAYATDGFDPTNATRVLFGYATAIVSGVGVIYAVIAIFNWVSAMRQDDAERQSKALINIFIAGVLIAIGAVTGVIINALGGSAPGSGGGLNSN